MLTVYIVQFKDFIRNLLNEFIPEIKYCANRIYINFYKLFQNNIIFFSQ